MQWMIFRYNAREIGEYRQGLLDNDFFLAYGSWVGEIII